MSTLLRLKIERDEDAQDPRVDHDNADIMFCKHGRYNLGDKDAEDPIERVEIITLEYPGGKRYELESDCDEDGYSRDNAPALSWESVRDMMEEHADDATLEALDMDTTDPGYVQACNDAGRAHKGYDYVRDLTGETEHRQRPGIALCRPLYLYDHGGITISAGAFACQWDSGQVGWQYITEAAIAENWPKERPTDDMLRAYMDATLETYDDYLTGNVHGYIVERGERYVDTRAFPHLGEDNTRESQGIEWEHEDSCWGFFGDWWKAGDPTGMGDSFDGELKELFDSMDYNDVGEWRYVASVPEEDRDED